MKWSKLLVCLVIITVASILLSGGCRSNQSGKIQTKDSGLQETMEAPQYEENEVADEIAKLLMETTAELEKCQKRVEALELEKEIIINTKFLSPEDLKKGLAELKALRQNSTNRIKEKSGSDVNDSNSR
jgi:hypothetical protein